MPQYPPNQLVGLNYAHITNAGTVIVKPTSGILSSVIVNQNTATATMALFDQSTTVTSTNSIGNISLTETSGPEAVPYDISFRNGLVVVSTGSVDATVVYK